MISIRKSLGDLERVEELRQLATSGYANAILSAAEYAVELDPGQAAEFRQHLHLIREQLECATKPEDYPPVQASLRGELRLYRDRAVEWLDRLHRDLQSAAMAVETLAGGFEVNGIDHEKRLAGDLRLLATVSSSHDLTFIRKTVSGAVASIAASWEQLRRANQLVIAQLNDEIQALHREIDAERRALFTDAASGAWNREKVNRRIEDNLNRDEVFCVLIANVTNLKRLNASHSRNATDAALQALVKRIHGIVGKDAMIGRWTEDEFAVLLELDPANAAAISGEMAKHLGGRYSVQESGIARTLTLRVNILIVDHPKGSSPVKFREKLAALG